MRDADDAAHNHIPTRRKYMFSHPRRLLGVALAGLVVLGAAGCTAAAPTPTGTAAASDAAWPRTVTHELGTTEIPEQPDTIVSTSLTISGTLLAMDAPLTASAATTAGSVGVDDRGFFQQWSEVATERDVDVLYPDLEVDLEAIIAAEPDLIVVSTTGADSAAAQYAELSAIAPTVVYNYGDKTWQDLAVQLGEATGLEQEAADLTASFDARVAEVAAAITVPEGTTNAIVYNGPELETAFAKPGGSHGALLTALGFDVVGAPDDLDTSERTRQDFAFLSAENVTTALTGNTVFLIDAAESTRGDLLAAPLYANAPAIQAEQVYSLGDTSFRIDYFSASTIVDLVEGWFAN